MRWLDRVALAVVLLVALGISISLPVVGVAAVGLTDPGPAATSISSFQSTSAVSEEAVAEPVPETGDAFFEAEADDGSWISYVNPRDEYRMPYLGEGSGKICVTLLNEAGEPILGESVPNTTATIQTGDELDWHGDADPFDVEFPLSTHYDRPLDADQFGTDPDVVQGDGMLDSHCLEWHGLPEDESVSYDPVDLTGEYADEIEVVGYVEQAHEAWDSDVDPLADAVRYEDAGGWTYHENGSHGQVVAVLQLDRELTDPVADDGDTSHDPDQPVAEESIDDAEALSGFGLLVGAASVLGLTLLVRRR